MNFLSVSENSTMFQLDFKTWVRKYILLNFNLII